MPVFPAASLYFSVDFSIFPLQLVTFQTPAAQICGTKLSPIDAVSRKGTDQGLTKQNQHQPDPESPPLLSEYRGQDNTIAPYYGGGCNPSLF